MKNKSITQWVASSIVIAICLSLSSLAEKTVSEACFFARDQAAQHSSLPEKELQVLSGLLKACDHIQIYQVAPNEDVQKLERDLLALPQLSTLSLRRIAALLDAWVENDSDGQVLLRPKAHLVFTLYVLLQVHKEYPAVMVNHKTNGLGVPIIGVFRGDDESLDAANVSPWSFSKDSGWRLHRFQHQTFGFYPEDRANIEFLEKVTNTVGKEFSD